MQGEGKGRGRAGKGPLGRPPTGVTLSTGKGGKRERGRGGSRRHHGMRLPQQTDDYTLLLLLPAACCCRCGYCRGCCSASAPLPATVGRCSKNELIRAPSARRRKDSRMPPHEWVAGRADRQQAVLPGCGRASRGWRGAGAKRGAAAAAAAATDCCCCRYCCCCRCWRWRPYIMLPAKLRCRCWLAGLLLAAGWQPLPPPAKRPTGGAAPLRGSCVRAGAAAGSGARAAPHPAPRCHSGCPLPGGRPRCCSI